MPKPKKEVKIKVLPVKETPLISELADAVLALASLPNGNEDEIQSVRDRLKTIAEKAKG